MGAAVLLIDDDAELLELLRDYLEREGFTVECRHDGISGVAAALSGQHDLVVLDIMMPELDGMRVLERIRSAGDTPVLMLSARGDDVDRIVGLEIGADDYVPKPCTPRELTARIRAILRRVAAPAAVAGPRTLRVGSVELWPARRRAQLAGVPLALTSTEFSILEVLVRNGGRPVSRAELSEAALGRPLSRFDRSVDVHISSIRHKLGALADGRSRIQTVIRRGYLLVAE